MKLPLIATASAGEPLAPPEFISASSVTVTANGNFTFTAPSGIADGDLIIAVLGTPFVGVEIRITAVPTGFELVCAAPAIFVKVASSESGDYTFTYAANTPYTWTGIMFVVRGANSIHIADSSNGTVGVSEVFDLPAATANRYGAMFAVVMTETAYDTSPHVLEGSPILEFDSAAATAGASLHNYEGVSGEFLAKEVSGLVQDDWYFGTIIHVVQEASPVEVIATATTQNSSAGGSLVIDKPTGTQEGDLLVAFMGATAHVTNGWSDTTFTEVLEGTASPTLRVCYKVAGASEPSTYTFSSTTTARTLAGSIVCIRNAGYIGVTALEVGDPLFTDETAHTSSNCMAIVCGLRASANTAVTIVGHTTDVSDSGATGPSYTIGHRPAPMPSMCISAIDSVNSTGFTGCAVLVGGT